MDKRNWIEQAGKNGILLLDGATGSNLIKAGLAVGASPERFVLENPQVMIDLQRRYVEAGSRILYAPTFSGNRIKLAEYGLERQGEEMTKRLVEISQQAAGGKALVAGNMTMTGRQLYPIGSLRLEELIDIYCEQARWLVQAGVDCFAVETMISLAEMRACILAIKQVSQLPIMATMTFADTGRTFFGETPEAVAAVLDGLAVAALGVNCSSGPDRMLPLIRQMATLTNRPLIAKANAGLPKLDNDGNTYYDMDAASFARHGRQLAEAGAAILGGCCGTDPTYIAALHEAVSDISLQPRETSKAVLASASKVLSFNAERSFIIVGERINPTGKKRLRAELAQGSFEYVKQLAVEQQTDGADILDINMGMEGIDEKESFLQAIREVTMVSELPLSLDSSHTEVLEAGLMYYVGRALINSVSLEGEKRHQIFPLAKRYGAMCVLLPIGPQGLPQSMEEKKAMIRELIETALHYGLTKDQLVVDALVSTIGADPSAARQVVEVIRYCHDELAVKTIVGLSNISFGLPQRGVINHTFLTMCMSAGLTMAIANPSVQELQTAAVTTDMLLCKEGADLRYIERMQRLQEAGLMDTSKRPLPSTPTAVRGAGTPTSMPAGQQVVQEQTDHGLRLYEDVLKGNRSVAARHATEALQAGLGAEQLLEQYLLPAINEVGRLFENKTYFLPQLIGSAEAMKNAIAILEPQLQRSTEGQSRKTVVIATVQGDIHDIGKNLVALMLKNHGYRVLDLGKDVPTEEIIETAKREQADIIGLSALMTTTMQEMARVVERVQQEALVSQVIIGGAVTTAGFADEIGADGYSQDAQEAVKLVERLLKKDLDV